MDARASVFRPTPACPRWRCRVTEDARRDGADLVARAVAVLAELERQPWLNALRVGQGRGLDTFVDTG
jgi:methylphosphotriester-DNA--protein-cysteine methyltransferase